MRTAQQAFAAALMNSARQPKDVHRAIAQRMAHERAQRARPAKPRNHTREMVRRRRQMGLA